MSKRIAIACLVVVLAVASASQAFAGQVFFIGEDNNSVGEMSHEGTADDNYHWENGDYTALGGENWTSGMEPWHDDVDPTVTPGTGDPEIGIERAWTGGDPTINLFFQLDAWEADPASEFTFEIDIYGSDGGLGTDFEFSMNGNVFYTGTNITPGHIITESFTGADVSAVAGSNVIQLNRTGGDAVWVTHDYISLSVVPEPSTLVLGGIGLLGLTLLGWRRKR